MRLIEQKPLAFSAAHRSSGFAELVCSNSLKAKRVESAAGLLKAEMRLLDSLSLQAADRCQLPAGGALAVDRQAFSDLITEAVTGHPRIEVVRSVARTITQFGDGPVIVATGPLTEGDLAAELAARCGEDLLYFYDAAAPVVSADSIDLSRVSAASRYGRGNDDYLNCFFTKDEYLAFHEALRDAETAPRQSQEECRYYAGCMPVEGLAAKGVDTLRFGPLKPVGLTDPATGRRPYAAVQLRRENAEGTMYNLVGFQTGLRFGEQKRVFSMIPGLEDAEFVRYGVMHRNTFVRAPEALTADLRLMDGENVWLCGQLTGFEGYMESAACGLLAAVSVENHLRGQPFISPPPETMCGSLLRYISTPNRDFQPMGAAMGLLPPLDRQIRSKTERYQALADRALDKMEGYVCELSSMDSEETTPPTRS